MTLLGWAICMLAITLLLIAAAGVLLLPDALARQHAATKAATLSVSLLALGLGLVAGDSAWTWRLVLVVVILLMTLPLASHALARAGVAELNREEQPTQHSRRGQGTNAPGRNAGSPGSLGRGPHGS